MSEKPCPLCGGQLTVTATTWTVKALCKNCGKYERVEMNVPDSDGRTGHKNWVKNQSA